jgi:hypothetical protein
VLNVVQYGKQLQVDSNGYLLVNLAAGSISGGNLAASTTGSGVPPYADYLGVKISGNLAGVSGLSLTNATPVTVAIVDGNGNQITSFGGGTQYSDGTTQTTPTGTVALGKNPSNVLHSLAIDASGNLLVNLNANAFGTLNVSVQNASIAVTQGATPWVDNLTQVAGTALGSSAIVNYGSTPGASAVPAVNAFITNTVAVSGSVAQSGTWSVTEPSIGAIGSAIPSYGVQIAGANGTNLQSVAVDSLGRQILADTGGEADILASILYEIRAMKTAIVALDNTANPVDFEAASYYDAITGETALP